MVQKSFHELPSDERKDFETACALHGFVREDFDVTAEEAIPQTDGANHIPRAITVARVIGGEARRYPGGNGSSWTAAFELDLEQDVFGFPLAD